MKAGRSSIFSFDTLRIRGAWPRAALLASALVVVAEVGARVLVSRRILAADLSLRDHVLAQTETLRRGAYRVWLVGNSTLGCAIHGDTLETVAPHVTRLIHGSANLSGSVAMLDYYLARVPVKPAAIMVFVSKDDLNAYGARAVWSREYHRIARTGPVRTLGDFLVLRGARSAIQGKAQRAVSRALAWSRRQASGGTSSPRLAPMKATAGGGLTLAAADHVFSGDPIPPDDPWFRSLADRFTLDADAIRSLKDICDRHGVASVSLVFLPATDVYAQFHDVMYPSLPYAAVRRQTGEICISAGIRFVDWGAPSKDYTNFRDAYHANGTGATVLTGRLITHLNE